MKMPQTKIRPSAAEIKDAAAELCLPESKRFRQGRKAEDTCYTEVCCLAAMLAVGKADADAIAGFLGWKIPRVQKFLEDARRAGVLGRDGKVRMGDDYFDKKTGTTAILLDAMAINGKLVRRAKA